LLSPAPRLELGDIEPAADCLAERDVGLWVAILVDLALQPRQRDLGSAVRLQDLADVSVFLVSGPVSA
jgi:hypothetical protein